MLKIFYGRESIDKEKFIYEKITETQGNTLVIVPDQYTLEAEKQAFQFLHVRGLMDVEIVSMSRLGYKLLAELGGGKRTFIDKYGRHMLLSQIAANHEEELQIFKGTLKKESFIEMTNNFISEMKQYNVTPETLMEVGENLSEDSLLKKKLGDLQVIYAAYEEKIQGKYTDSEDYIDLYMEKIEKSAMIKGSQIWVYGFDSFAPKALKVLGHLMGAAEDVNIFLTYEKESRNDELFLLPEIVMTNLIKEAKAFGVSYGEESVGDIYRVENHSDGIKMLEKQIFAPSKEGAKNSSGITVVEAANMYNEAESAASFILHLVRDKGLRYRDIVVICNDQQVRGSVISRVFDEYGISLFDDRKRNILNAQIALFVVGFLETLAGKYRRDDVFKVLKTGFFDLSDEEIERLENYTIKYRIKGTMWKRPFVKGVFEYGDQGLNEMNLIREKAIKPFEQFETTHRTSLTVGEFIEQYYDFLITEVGLGQQISQLMKRQEAQGLLDMAAETAQIWGLIVGIFDQIKELTGDQQFLAKDFLELLTIGLSQIEVGVLPPTADDILMGTMQRTRCGTVKAVIVMGANEGILPSSGGDNGLFTLEELDFLAEAGREICKVDQVRVMEEKLAIYRNLAKATDYLWIGFSTSDEDGGELRPSEVIDQIKKIFPEIQVAKDVLNRNRPADLIGGRVNTLKHLTTALVAGKKGEKIDGIWEPVMEWLSTKAKDDMDKINAGLSFTNKQKPLNVNLAKDLYKREGQKNLTLSPSRLEKFSRCPFSHFIAYGLRPEERRIFKAESREIGDIYHKCLMEICGKLTAENAWNQITEEDCQSLVTEILTRETEQYREGVFQFSNEEKYKTSRIEKTCFLACWALIEQVRAGKIKESKYEVAFGREREIPPVILEVDGEAVYIEGKIDRLDILEGERVKIMDYKTGSETFNIAEARAGYRLQLMVYLKAAQGKTGKPAGAFYFQIKDVNIDLGKERKEKISEKISKEMRKFFKLNGIMVNDGEIISGIAGEFEGFSEILPLRKVTNGIQGTSKDFLISEEEFETLQIQVDDQLQKICNELTHGRIDIVPKKSDKKTPCTYCEYKGICRFDPEFPGCHYEIV